MVLFRLLGTLEVGAPGQALTCGPPKQRATLVALLMDAGSAVQADTLIDRVWGEAAPPVARSTLYAHISRIRSLLARLDPPVAVDSRGGGYALVTDPDQVDVHRARRLITAARAGAAQPAGLLRQALDLWRGPALADVDGTWAEQARQNLSQLRLSATIQWADLALAGGQPDPVLDGLAAVADDHPYTESLVAVRMRALFQAGRAAEAMHLYAETCHRLAEDLGTDPGPELRDTHCALLRGELPRPAQAAPAALAAVATPRQLPADVAGFTGRDAELGELDELLAQVPSTVVISAVSGPPGIGKTSLTVHWAHRMARQFPEGQLYVDLRGYDPDRPVPAGEALAGFLRALGVAAAAIPPELPERAALFRSLVADRRMLVLLDNAVTTAQVTPLLPGSPTCLALVTSRDRLAGLVARHGARRLTLDLLPLADAVALLATLVGNRIRDNPGAAQALAQQCARLPLAVRIVAEHLADHADRNLATVATELADEQRRLDLLDLGGDPTLGVRSVFSWSYRRLSPATARGFRLLGLHPGPDLDRYAVAALLGIDLAPASQLLDTLAGRYLIGETQPGRFGMHDLLAAYARECAAADPEPDRRAAMARLFDYYLASASAATSAIAPFDHLPQLPPPPGPVPSVAGRAAAQTWLDQNRACLIRLASRAASEAGEAGWDERVAILSDLLWRYLDSGGHYPEAEQLHAAAAAASEAAGDLVAAAAAQRRLAIVYERTGRTPAAIAQAERAVELAHGQGAGPAVAASTAGTLGSLLFTAGRYAQAATHFRRAIDLTIQLGDTNGAGTMLGNLAGVYLRWGRFQQALAQARRALAMLTEAGNQAGVGMMLGNLGEVYEHLGRYQEALDHHRRSLAVFREHGIRSFEGRALGNQARALQRLGQPDQALEVGQEALSRVREVGDREGEIAVLDLLGLASADLGRFDDAIASLGQALDLAVATGDRAGEANAFNGLADVQRAAGRPDEAITYYRAALEVATQIGDRPAQARARAGLADIATA